MTNEKNFPLPYVDCSTAHNWNYCWSWNVGTSYKDWFIRHVSFTKLLIGTLLALVLNTLWVLVVIGALPLAGQGQGNILAAFHENLPATVPLSMALHSKVITTAGMFFSLAAIITSYFGVGIAFMGFFRDVVSSYGKKSNRFIEAGLTFGPPFIVALVYPPR